MNELKTIVESIGKFKVSKIENGLTRIHAHDSRFTLGAVCNESNISGSIRTKEGNTLYQTKLENESFDTIKNKIAELCTMYKRASEAFSEDVKSDVEKTDKSKQVLLDDTVLPGIETIDTDGKVIVDLGGRIVASAEGESHDIDDIIVEDPVTSPSHDTIETAEDKGMKKDKPKSDNDDSDLEIDSEKSETVDDTENVDAEEVDNDADLNDDDADVDSTNTDENNTDESNDIEDKIEDSSKTASNFNDVKSELIKLADTVASLVNDFDDTDADNKLVATGLSSQLYNIALDVSAFVEQFTTKSDLDINSNIEDSKSTADDSEESDEVKESLCVPSKVDYIDMARGGINQARKYLSADPEKFGYIIEMLSDLNSELVTQFK